jgi:hydroxyacylglutathione hydrolase
VGDALFSGSIGRTDLWGGDHKQLIDNIQSKLLTLSPDTIVYPGHGPFTTIGEEQTSNPFLQG